MSDYAAIIIAYLWPDFFTYFASLFKSIFGAICNSNLVS
jgi:hypothetical protein